MEYAEIKEEVISTVETFCRDSQEKKKMCHVSRCDLIGSKSPKSEIGVKGVRVDVDNPNLYSTYGQQGAFQNNFIFNLTK